MASVWYIGRSDVRTITAAEWTAAGITGSPATTTWDKTNGWSIPTTSFTAPQLALLAADTTSFNTAGADGPRPGASASPADYSGVPITKGFFDSVNAGVQAALKKQRLSNGPLHRYRNNFRRLGPVTTDLTSAAASASHDATLTKAQYTAPVAGISVNTLRKMTDAEVAACPFNVSPQTGTNPRLWNVSGNAWIVNTSGSSSVDETYYFPNITQHRFECMTDAPVIEFCLYNYLGTAIDSIQAYVDGSPVTLAPVAHAGIVTYYKITFPSGKKPRLVEIVTGGALNSIATAPLYRCWKPPLRRGPKLMVLGASMVQPFIWSGTAQTYLRHGHWSQMDAYADIDQLVTDGVGGTGYVTAAASGIAYPNNKFTDRIQGILNVKPDVLILADSFSNDLKNGASTASIITAATSMIQQIQAGLPDCRIAIQTGVRTPVYGDFTAGYDTIKAALKAAFPTLYWMDIRNVFDTTGGYAPNNTNGLGNTDYYIGNDGVHPTKEGGDYLRGILYPAVQKLLWDDGTLAGTELI